MFKKAYRISFFTLFAWGCIFLIYFSWGFQSAYQPLSVELEKSSPKVSFKKNTKIFYSFDEGAYKKAQFTSASSLIERKEGRWQESLTNLQGMIQTKLYVTKITHLPMQQVYQFTSSSGKYDYKSNKLYAPLCNFSFFFDSGHTLPKKLDEKKLFLQGIAKWTSFAIKPQLKFAADRLKMVIHKDNEQRKIK